MYTSTVKYCLVSVKKFRSEKTHTNTYLLLLFVFELERRFDTASFVKKASTHVDLTNIFYVKANTIQTHVEY